MKFNLRDMFWLTVVVALAIAWWQAQVSERRWRRDLDNREGVISILKSQLAEHGEEINIEYNRYGYSVGGTK